MLRHLGLLFGLLLVAVVIVPTSASAQSVSGPIVMQFNQVGDQYDRYMFRLSLQGAVIKPWTAPDILSIPEFGVNAIWEDRVTSVSEGMNKHSIHFYRYDVSTLNFSSGYDPGSGTAGGGSGGPAAGPGGGRSASIGNSGMTISPKGSGLPLFSDMNDKHDGFSAPGSLGLAGDIGEVPSGNGSLYAGEGFIGPMQDNFGVSGGPEANFDISKITTSDIKYVTLKNGQIIDVRGLELMSDYSDAQVNNEEIIIDVENIFEWSHLLVLPPYPVYLEDFWYAELPMSVPGLPEKIPMKLYYQVMDFRRVMTRRIVVIDLSGLVEFDQYWDIENKDERWTKKYRAFGHMSISARYMYDIDKNEIFAIARPIMLIPRNLFKGNAVLPGDYRDFGNYGLILRGIWGMNHPGMSVTTNMRYFTRFEDERKLRTSAGLSGPEYERKFLDITYFAQMEAE